MDVHHPLMRNCNPFAYSSDPERDASRYMDATAVWQKALQDEEARLKAETLQQAKDGVYERLIGAMDYRNNYETAMAALVAAAQAGHKPAVDAINTLAQTYAELHAEVD